VVAPDSWVKSFESISDTGQKCLIKAISDPATADIYNNDNLDAIKQDLKSKCPEYAKEFNNFIDTTSETLKSLPTKLLEALRDVRF
jgi:hypothetical protein